MGSWDLYCAICGGPTSGAEVSSKPRSARFLRRRAREAEIRKAQNIPQTHPVSIPSDTETMEEYEARKAAGGLSSGSEDSSDDDDADDDADENDGDSMCTEDEMYTYDPTIVTAEEVAWTEGIRVLGQNPDGSCFVSGIGRTQDYGRVLVPFNDTPTNANGVAGQDLVAYWDIDDGPVVFPFHPCCYEILACCIIGGRDTARLDKERLFGVMKELTTEFCPRLELDYGDPCPEMEQYWCSHPGEEIFVAEPKEQDNLRAHMRSILAGEKFQLRVLDEQHSEVKAANRVSSDVFRNLPYDVIYAIAELLPASSLVAFSQASRTLHALLTGKAPLWKRGISQELPWFYELIRLLQEPEVGAGLNFSMVLDWAQKVTKPRLAMQGPFLPVANRRRIWGVCEQLCQTATH
ncbi:hypothetical protein B0T14DRAFT_508253 [Immersiella caudata]|uniref:F-box domain-containing protein n=1 Tax=Immersiella caudata TaxID=314043 RepID=A0AA39XHJ3_9PEZI|nr:hypothetical protein B0T14DRAFT_508253 [Immersiella caudata]